MTNGENPQNGHGSGFLMGLLTGAVVGAGLGLLFAPRAGAEFRSQVGDLPTSLGNAASRRYRQASSRAGEAVAELIEKGQEVRAKVWDAVARGAQQVEDYATDGKTALDRDPQGPSGRRSPTVSRGSDDPAL